MGKPIKIRTKVKDGIAQVKALMPHVMESGRRRDPVSKELIPEHYITEVVAEHNGEIVLTAYWGTAISRNPFLSFSFSGAAPGDTLKIQWKDNRDDSSVTEIALK